MNINVFENFTECYLSLASQVFNEYDFICEPRGQAIREKLGVKFTITNPRHRIPYVRVRNFSISINNNVEPRYYIERRGDSRVRGPSDIVEMRREYTMTATIALPDSEASATGTTASLFKELMLEGDYGLADGTSAGMKGFAIQLVFNKGTVMTGVTGVAIGSVDHKITIDIPTDDATPYSTAAAATGLNNQGAFLTEAPHPIDGSNPFEVSASMIFRNMGITIVDNVGLYP